MTLTSRALPIAPRPNWGLPRYPCAAGRACGVQDPGPRNGFCGYPPPGYWGTCGAWGAWGAGTGTGIGTGSSGTWIHSVVMGTVVMGAVVMGTVVVVVGASLVVGGGLVVEG